LNERQTGSQAFVILIETLAVNVRFREVPEHTTKCIFVYSYLGDWALVKHSINYLAKFSHQPAQM